MESFVFTIISNIDNAVNFGVSRNVKPCVIQIASPQFAINMAKNLFFARMCQPQWMAKSGIIKKMIPF